MGGSYSQPAEISSRHFPEFRSALPSMAGKIVVITGTTSGTGYICAKACAELGAKVVTLNRASARADAAQRKLQEEVPGCTVTTIPCDLMSFASVRKAGKQLRDELGGSGIDVLCNNAGIMGTKDQATEDGCDTQMQTNHLSHFLLTAEVFPLLEKAAASRGEARIVNHSSGARKFPKEALDPKYLGKNGGQLGGDELGWGPFSGGRWKRYQQTKLANVVFTYALDDKLKAKGSKVKAVVAHPGLSATNLQVTSASDGGMGMSFTDCFMRNLSQSGEDGTMPLLTCCCASEVQSRDFYGPKGMTGPTRKEPEETLADASGCSMLWEESQRSTGANFTC